MGRTIYNAKCWRFLLEGLGSWGAPPPLGIAFDTYYYARADALYKDQIGDKKLFNREYAPQGNEELMIAAVVLLTYGRLDVVADILEVPIHPVAQISTLRRSVWTLIPFPPDIRHQRNAKVAIAWVERNKDRLHWDKEEGYFVLTDPAPRQSEE